MEGMEYSMRGGVEGLFFGELSSVGLDRWWTNFGSLSQLKGNRAKLRAARKVAKGAREPRDRGVNRVSQQKEGDQNCGFRRLLKGEEERGRVWSILARGVLRQRQSDYKIIYCPDRPNQQGRDGASPQSERGRRAVQFFFEISQVFS